MARCIVVRMMMPCALLPHEWCDHRVQAQLLACGLSTAVYSKGLDEVVDGFSPGGSTHAIVPFWGDKFINRVWQATGNPMADLPREHLCIAMSPVIPGFTYDWTFYGVVDEDAQLPTKRPLPRFFQENVHRVVHATHMAIAAHTTVPYQVVAMKLNPLASGRANVAIHLLFERPCPFERQQYLSHVRVIPRPIMTHDGELGDTYEFSVPVINGDARLFDTAYDMFQAFVEKEVGLHMRHIRTSKTFDAIFAVAQVTPGEANKKLTLPQVQWHVDKFNARHRGQLAGYVMGKAGMGVQQLDHSLNSA